MKVEVLETDNGVWIQTFSNERLYEDDWPKVEAVLADPSLWRRYDVRTPAFIDHDCTLENLDDMWDDVLDGHGYPFTSTWMFNERTKA